jgi:hypothetical protein
MVQGLYRRLVSAIAYGLFAVSFFAAIGTQASTPARPGFDVPTEKHALALDIVTSEQKEEGRVTLRFTLPRAGIVRISIASLDGKEMGTLASGLSSAGENRLDVDVSRIPPGQYRLSLQTRDGNASTRLVVAK